MPDPIHRILRHERPFSWADLWTFVIAFIVCCVLAIPLGMFLFNTISSVKRETTIILCFKIKSLAKAETYLITKSSRNSKLILTHLSLQGVTRRQLTQSAKRNNALTTNYLRKLDKIAKEGC